MASIANVVDGSIVSGITETETSGKIIKEKTAEESSSLDKDAFLQLLVAQMKYQDPMEPTSNTEYISQYATFSELEQMQNMSSSMELQRASALVGQYATVNYEKADGSTATLTGKVDSVAFEGNSAYLNIGGEYYNIDDVVEIVESEYEVASALATSWLNSLNRLPAAAAINTGHEDVITNLRQVYDDMTDYQKSFISDNYVRSLEAYEERLKVLKAAEEAADTGDEDGETDDTSDPETVG